MSRNSDPKLIAVTSPVGLQHKNIAMIESPAAPPAWKLVLLAGLSNCPASTGKLTNYYNLCSQQGLYA